ncbi:hypothetical protein [Herbiconiux solani]|uniref:hypothetical protein n=1 Tax=Herbiconiux solani TaxID=661329 RepID=UPI000825BD03|nr:hypothetical protein [Herbiconiux solani]
MTADLDLAASLLEAVTAVPGVRSVYPAEPFAKAVLDQAVAVVTGRAAPLPVGIVETPAGLEIALTIGVSDEVSASETCRTVYRVIHEILTAAGFETAMVRVVVASVD